MFQLRLALFSIDYMENTRWGKETISLQTVVWNNRNNKVLEGTNIDYKQNILHGQSASAVCSPEGQV